MYPSSAFPTVVAFMAAVCFAGAATSPARAPDPAGISASELASIAEAASKRWEATGLTDSQKSTLRGLRYEVADLEDGVLGAYREGSIKIDINGAGQGWYVDATPHSDDEFRNVGSATQLAGDGDLTDRVDVLSVMLQEQGHALGLEDSFSDPESVMFAFNAEGVRLLPAKGQAEGAIPGSLQGTHFSHYRGGSVTHTVSESGLLTLTVFSVWRADSIDTPFFQLYNGPNGTSGAVSGSFTTASANSTYATGTELGGNPFAVSRHVFTRQLPAAGTYYAYWTSCCRVSGINNAPADSWTLETGIKWAGSGTTSGSPTQREATIDIAAKGHTYTQNLNSVDPDGKPVSFQFLTGSAAPNYGPTSQIQGINLDSLGNVNISAANTNALATGRWIYKTRVTDADGAYSDRDVMIVVENSTGGAGNNPNGPVLANIPNRTVAVGSPLSFGVSATDADNDQLTIRAQLLPSGSTLPQVVAPNGAVSSTFNWTPTAGQEGVYTINVEAFDSSRAVPIIASQLVQITVSGSNTPPVLDPIGNKTVANGGTVSFTVSGSDPDGDAITLSEYFLPAGATFNPATGAFSWTPTAGQYNNTATGVTFRVTDDGVPNLYTEETINITVGAGNAAPVITPVATVSAQVGQALTIPITVTDAAGQTVTVTAPIRPTGSTFTSTPGTTPVSGTFSWTPTAAGTETLRIRAEDNGSPILSSTFDITIEVTDNLPPVVTLNGVNPVTMECYVDFYTELGATATDPEDGTRPVVITGTVDRTHVGTYTKTYTATDSDGVAVSVTRTINVVDTRPPVITIPTNILIPSVVPNPSGPTLSNPVFYSPTVTASDVATGNRPVTLSHPTGTRFPVGRTLVTVSASDPSGNSATRTFEVIVLEYQESPGVRFMDMVAFRGAAATGAPAGTIFNINRAFVNNRSDVIYDAVLTGAGANDNVVFYGPLNGAQAALAVKGAASGVGNFGAFSNLTLNHLGHAGFESLVGSTPAQFRSAGGAAAAVSAVKSGLAPTGTGEAFNTLYQPAMSSNGLLLTPSTLQLGSGAGVTISNDTLINTSGGGVIAREGAPTSVAGVNYGQLHPRVVASRANEKYAFAAFLETAVFDPDTNTGLFVGTLGGGAPDLVVREGDAANGVTGGRMFQFLGESVNSAGGIAFRASVTGGAAVTAANNDGIWTNAGNVGAPPVLVAREGAIVPVSPANRVSFSRFTTLHMQDDGSVVFFAFLQNATAVAVVNSNNDGSIWRWSAGRLTLLAREGELANNTAGARILNINGFDCNDVGGMVYDATLVPGVGDTTTATNQAVFLNRGNGLDPAPLLTMRRNDSFTVEGNEHSVAGIKISTSINSGGGTGGYGRAINDSGEVVFNLTLSGNKSGIFLLGSAPAN